MFPIEDTRQYAMSTTDIFNLLQKHDEKVCTCPSPIKVMIQADGGANRSVTNDRTLLSACYDIEDYPMGGIGTGIVCTARGLYHMKCDDESIITVDMFYSPDATHTVISPTDTVTKHKHSLECWWQISDVKRGVGQLNFF